MLAHVASDVNGNGKGVAAVDRCHNDSRAGRMRFELAALTGNYVGVACGPFNRKIGSVLGVYLCSERVLITNRQNNVCLGKHDVGALLYLSAGGEGGY